ncbi:MAG TPA: ATP-binding cassette domain-containing protein, partial [Kofleriaceae bacterium]|nr:ATP-binding cassette domain-containing protein [Kofleriaceae bacterium]
MTAILTVQGLEKRFGTRHVLNGASFAVHERDRIGMIGANGAGKSTLLEMVVRAAMASRGDTGARPGQPSARARVDHTPDAGVVTWKRDLVLEYVAQEPRLDPDAPVAAALRLPPMGARVGDLSLGERRRVALAHALLGRADVLALDEPTNHLDATTVEWLEGRL